MGKKEDPVFEDLQALNVFEGNVIMELRELDSGRRPYFETS